MLPLRDQPHLGRSHELAGQHVAPGDGPDARGVEDLPHLSRPQLLLHLLRLQHPHQGRLDVFDGLVDDPVGANVHLLLLGQSLGSHRRPHVEADDHSLGGRRQHDVGFVDAAHSGEHHLHLDLGMGDVEQRFFESFHRTAHVTLDDQRKFLDLALFDTPVELVQTAAATPALGQLLLPQASGALLGLLPGFPLVLCHRSRNRRRRAAC